MNNIFEGAKFGDKFITIDGRIGVLVFLDTYAILAVKNQYEFNSIDVEYGLDGNILSNVSADWSIISKYQEPINEDKLEEIADEHFDIYEMKYDGVSREEHNVAYKAGYRQRAKEEN